ncbi:MAG TPA: hypothetical protein DGG95_02730 [Cytophagales bacterium]|nr:hypothetical protein [Cytophagales bacterium]
MKPGDTFNYTYRINWDSTDPQATVPTQYVELNNTQFIRITVITVTGSLINADFTRHFNNGTEQTQNGNIDVNTQILEIPYSTLIIRADANPGEKIYPAGGHAILNDTATRTYSIGQVDAVRYVSPDTTGGNSEKTEIYYDRTNGVAVEYNFISQVTTGSYVTTTRETVLINSWVIPEFPVAAVLIILLLAIPMLLIAYKKKPLLSNRFSVFLK